jgi:heterodisulfide reductase subunit C
VRVVDVMCALRNIATKSGFAPPAFIKQLELIYNFGTLYEIDDFDNRRREKIGLPQVKVKPELAKTLIKEGELDTLLGGK